MIRLDAENAKSVFQKSFKKLLCSKQVVTQTTDDATIVVHLHCLMVKLLIIDVWCPMLRNCHINVEHVADMNVVKYLHKYVFKGPDAAIIEREMYKQDGSKKILDYDEISAFVNCRYLSAPEATWRILNYGFVDKSHSVERLDLPDMQSVFLEEGASDDAIQQAKNKTSKLMAFF